MESDASGEQSPNNGYTLSVPQPEAPTRSPSFGMEGQESEDEHAAAENADQHDKIHTATFADGREGTEEHTPRKKEEKKHADDSSIDWGVQHSSNKNIHDDNADELFNPGGTYDKKPEVNVSKTSQKYAPRHPKESEKLDEDIVPTTGK